MTDKPKILLLIGIIAFLFSTSVELKADMCSEEVIFDGAENVVGMGIDTTGHYWIITSPVQGYYRLIIDGKQSDRFKAIKMLRFSNDGQRWVCFVKDNVNWNIMTNDTLIRLDCDSVLNIGFSPNSEVLYYAYKIGTQVFYKIGNRALIRSIAGTGEMYVSWAAKRYAIGEIRGDRKIYKLQGWETPTYDEIRPLGFWNDGEFLYLVKIGNYWEIYKGKESISETYTNITEAAMNIWGTAAGFLARRSSNDAVGILLSDEYYEPLISKSYESVSGLALNPMIDLIAFKATYNRTNFIVLSSTEYSGGEETGNPHWTYDGSELYFSGCSSDCFINIDGRKYNLNQMFERIDDFVVKPGSKTIAYASGSNLVVRDITSGSIYAGKMMDYVTKPIYDWGKSAYVALGRIANRVYLLQCAP